MNSQDLDELVALYALNALDAEEQAGVEELYCNQPEFQLAVSESAAIAAMLAYDAPPLPMAVDLKARLFQRIAAEASPEDDQGIAVLLEQSKTAHWQPYPFASGVQVATVRVDAQTRQVDCFVRGMGQIKFPNHRHAGDEEIVVLEGDLVIGDQYYAKGDRIYSQPGTAHQPETLEGCVLFLRTSLDDEILSSAASP